MHVRDALKADGTFKDKYLLWMPYDEYGSLDEINPTTDKHFKGGLIKDADLLGSANAKQRDFFLWKIPKFSDEQYKSWLGRKKPCIKGSDCHNQNDPIGRLKDKNSQPTDRCCWIKADPTFFGLRQVINEPEDRIYLGVIPPKLARVNDNRTQFVSKLHIGKSEEANTPERWFDSEIPLSHDMIAIIGNKGSGKSALADIIALAGDTSRQEYFSFLQKKKFREKKLARNFQLTATWEDGTPTTRNLQEDPEPNKPERITYIPQEYLESVCTETSVDEESAFQQELRKVIFSHIADAQTLGKSTLQELIDYKTEEITVELARRRQELSQINAKISSLQQKAAPSFKQQMQEALALKAQEFEAHEGNKPAEVPKPDNLSDDQKKAYALIEGQLATKNASILNLDNQIRAAQLQQKALLEQESVVVKLEARLLNIERDMNAQREQGAALCSQIGLDFSEILQFSINREPLNKKGASSQTHRESIGAQLLDENPDSLVVLRSAALAKVEELKSQLDAPSKRHQDYLQQLRLWQERKEQIDGSIEAAGSLRHIEAQLKYVADQLPAEIAAAKNARRAAALNIHKSISSIRKIYEDLFAPVQHIITQEIVIKEGFKLSFVSAIVQRGFLRDFFEGHVSQGVNGSFCGKDAGEKRLKDMIEDCDFDDPQQAIDFAEMIEDHLNFDRRAPRPTSISLATQLRKHSSIKDLYDYLWSFSYLLPEYSLKLDGKDLSLLSPGERGALLLVFYLLVDKSDGPIIVDQPEENLDNQTVFHLLIPVIRKVKQNRQVIMVNS